MTTAATSAPSGHGLRPGQAEALKRWAEALRRGSRSELVVVPVGYGKTVIGVGSFEVAAGVAGADTCLYLTPTDVLRTQVFNGVEKALGVVGSTRPIRKLLAENAAPDRVRAMRANFVVATYQQVMASPAQYERLCASRRVHLVCDEAHHLGEKGRWAATLSGLGAATTILLSATPVRLDRDAIAGARYVEEVGGLSIDPLVNVSMRQAWKERRILKHLNMQMKDYAVQLRDSSGDVREFTASEMAELPDFDQRCVREQLRWNEDYVQPLVREFAITLQTKLALAPGQHQGLVFAATTEHANHLLRVFERWHPELRCVVVHSVDINDAENDRRLRDFHARKYDVLIQVKKASEGFDAPTVSVLLKLDAVFSREPVIQQLGRGLRFNHGLPEAQNLLNVFIGRDPRLAGIIEHLEREAPPPQIARRADDPTEPLFEPGEDERDEPGFDDELVDETLPEIVDVVEAGDVHLDHTGQFVEGQQLTMFGVPAPAPAAPLRAVELPGAAPAPPAGPDVVDLAAEMREAVEYCKTWTNRAARLRADRRGPGENHHAALNLAYARESGRRGALSTPAEYTAKGDWMKRQYLAMLG
ncbi:MAG: DEAD/DEAH box helicase family protein [Dehalococcoidia bacterium]|nr:DEAD/DEAH box helicase family protein [Dehalococcoidia bacterium]